MYLLNFIMWIRLCNKRKGKIVRIFRLWQGYLPCSVPLLLASVWLVPAHNSSLASWQSATPLQTSFQFGISSEPSAQRKIPGSSVENADDDLENSIYFSTTKLLKTANSTILISFLFCQVKHLNLKMKFSGFTRLKHFIFVDHAVDGSRDTSHW